MNLETTGAVTELKADPFTVKFSVFVHLDWRQIWRLFRGDALVAKCEVEMKSISNAIEYNEKSFDAEAKKRGYLKNE